MPENGSDLRAQANAGNKKALAIVKNTRRDIDEKVKLAINKANFATASSTRDALYASIFTSYTKLNKDINKFLKKQSSEVADYWYKKTADELGKDSVKLASFGKFSQKHLDEIEARVNPFTIENRSLISPRLGMMAQEDVTAIRGIVVDVMREGATTGLSTPEMGAMMKAKVLDYKPALVIRDKIGRKWKADSYFAMVNRTLTAEVARETTTELAVESGNDLVRVTGRSSDPNSPCIPYEGEILSLTGATPGYTTVAEAEANGLYHPNCIHGMVAVRPSQLERAEKNQAEARRRRADNE